MKAVTGVLVFLLALLRIVAYEWIFALQRLLERAREIIVRWRQRQDLPKRARKASDDPCIPVREEAFHRPDPLIYSQYDLMRRGYAVTWDNPDIELRAGGVAVPSWKLAPDTEYEIVARIWNSATDAPIVGLPVIFSYLSFGIGIQGHPIGATAIDLGVKGGPNHPALATVKWRTPAGGGHFCIVVLLAPADDTNPANNLGQENINVAVPASPAEFTFVLRNQTARAQGYRFEVDTYRIPELPPCAERPAPNGGHARHPPPKPGDRPAVPPAHDRRNYPVPAGWTVAFDPAEPQLAAGGQTTITARITGPDTFHGRQTFNLNAFDRNGFAGGVTLYVDAP